MNNLVNKSGDLVKDLVKDLVNDCISRQAAIKTAHLPVIDDAGYEVVRVNDILELPSAQPVAKDINVPVKDCISRAAAIDAMRKAKDKSEAHRMLVQLPSAQPWWIPVTERLPEKDGQYYVTQLRYGVYDSKMTGAYVRETNYIWYSVRHKRWSVMANCKVVAWIEELPKPWEGDANG